MGGSMVPKKQRKEDDDSGHRSQKALGDVGRPHQTEKRSNSPDHQSVGELNLTLEDLEDLPRFVRNWATLRWKED